MVYGLFEDVDDMVTLLVIEQFAMSFRDREPSDLEANGAMLSVSRAERYVLLTPTAASSLIASFLALFVSKQYMLCTKQVLRTWTCEQKI